MARFHIAAALGAATMVLLITLQLISHFGLPALDFINLTKDAFTLGSTANQYLFKSPYNAGEKYADDGTLYMVGVGKADITGYSSWV